MFLFTGPRISTSRSQSYSGQQGDHPDITITMDEEPPNALYLDDETQVFEDSSQASVSKVPFSVSGQYSKSIHVNTQSKAHTLIYDPDMPIFDLDHSVNVTALLGKTAVLNCRVKNIGNKTVSTLLILS